VFSQEEVMFLDKMEECRVATSHDNMPHVKPVSYLYEEGTILIATDYDTRMYKNLLENPKVALSIDIYKNNGHKAICLQSAFREMCLLLKKEMNFQEFIKNFMKDLNG